MPKERQSEGGWCQQLLSKGDGEASQEYRYCKILEQITQYTLNTTNNMCLQPPAAHQYGTKTLSALALYEHTNNDTRLENHPYLQQAGFAKWHKDNNIIIMQYSPFGNQNQIYDKGQNMGKLMEDDTLVEIGKKYNKSGAQVALAWGITHG